MSKLTEIWICPACREPVCERAAAMECTGCAKTFDVVSGIPDFRLSVPRYLDRAADLAFARELAASNLPLDRLVHTVYSRRPGWDQARIELRTRQVLEGREKLHGDLAAGSTRSLRAARSSTSAAAAEC